MALSLHRPVFFAIAVLGLLGRVTANTTWYVDVQGVPPGTGTEADPYTSLQYAIEQPTTADGDTLLVQPGTYVENVHFRGKVLVVRSVAGPESTTLRAVRAGAVVEIDTIASQPKATLDGFTVTGSIGASSPGIRACEPADAAIVRCIVRDNEGAGVFWDYDGIIERTTIAHNRVGFEVTCKAAVFVTSCIVWDNEQDSDICPGFATFTYNDMQGPIGQQGTNISADPRFWSPTARDYALKPGSPCIDGGNPHSDPDPDGSRVDMGALTFDATYGRSPEAYCTAKVNSCGSIATIGADGASSASATSGFVISAAGAKAHRPGLLLYSDAGPAGLPFEGGLLCLEPPLRRSVAIVDDRGSPPGCDGVLSLDMNAFASGALGGQPAAFLVIPGSEVFCQFWGRDTLAAGSLLSDALRFVVCE